MAAGIGSGLGGALLVVALVLWLRHRRIKASVPPPRPPEPPTGRPSSLKKRSTYNRFDDVAGGIDDVISSTGKGSGNKRMTCVGVELSQGHTAPAPPSMPPPPPLREEPP